MFERNQVNQGQVWGGNSSNSGACSQKVNGSFSRSLQQFNVSPGKQNPGSPMPFFIGSTFNSSHVSQNQPFPPNSSPAPSPPAQHRVLLSYDENDMLSLTIANDLRKQLEEKYDVLTFSYTASYASSPQNWYDDLYTAVGLSHAAVVLLSSKMFKSRDTCLYKALNLLAVRTLKHIDAFHFVFMPILIDHIQPSGPEFSDTRLIASALKDFSPLQSSDSSSIYAYVLEKLQSLKKHPRSTHLDFLGDRIGKMLQSGHFNAKILAGLLEINLDLDSGIDFFTQVGWAMWRNNFLANYDLLQHFTLIYSHPLSSKNRKKQQESPYKALLKLLFPSWIDPWVALWLPIATDRPRGERAIVLNRLDSMIVECIVRRAYCCSPDYHLLLGKIIDMRAYDRDGGTMEELIYRTRQELLTLIMGKEAKWKTQLKSYKEAEREMQEAEWETQLKSHIAQLGPIFVILSLHGPEEIQQLMTAFKDVTFFFLTDGKYPEDTGSLAMITLPKLALCEEDITAYNNYRSFFSGIQ